MKTYFSTEWKGSKQPRKQRKYLYNMPAHIKGNLLGVHLSSELRKKHSMRSIRVKKGDKVKVIRGQFKGHRGTVEQINLKDVKVMISKLESTKKDGTKSKYPIHPSNLMIEELDLSDKRRLKTAQKEEKPKQVAKPVETKPVVKPTETKENPVGAKK